MNSAKRQILGTAPWVIPLAVFAACLFFDLRSGEQAAWRPARVAFMAGVIQCVAFLAMAPWWGAALALESPMGAWFAGLRVAVACAGSAALLALLMLFEAHPALPAVLRVEAAALGIGLLAAGLGAALGALFRSKRGVPAGVTLLGFALSATPFWGAAVIRLASEGWKPLACHFVTYATPISACADATGYDFYHGAVYDALPVSDYSFFVVPQWWTWALVTGAAGIVLLGLSAAIRRRATRT